MFARFVYALLVFFRTSFLQNPKKTWTLIVDRRLYTYCGRVADWDVTLTKTLTKNLTVTLTLTPKKIKGKCSDSNLCFNLILKWMMNCEASLGVSLKNVTVLSQIIFSCASDRLARKMSLYI